MIPNPPIRSDVFLFREIRRIEHGRTVVDRVPIGLSRPWIEYFNALTAGVQDAEDVAVADAIRDAPLSRDTLNREAEERAELLKESPQSVDEDELLQDSFLQNEVAVDRYSRSIDDLNVLLSMESSRSWSSIKIIQTTWANRANYPAAAYPVGSFLQVTDHTLVFIQNAGTWKYLSGFFTDTLANIPTAVLGTADAGLRFEVSDYSHVLVWGGAAWGPNWGVGNPDESGRYALFEAAPAGVGVSAWALCDGSTVARLDADGTTTNVTLDDVTTARYLKAGLTSAGVAAASGVTATENAHTHDVDPPSTASGAPSATVLAITDPAGTAVGDGTHTHTTDIASFTSASGTAHSHGPGTQELANLRKRLYFRR